MHPRRIGPYRIEGELGVGGMGEVYRAYDERLERSVAIKLIRPEALKSSEALRRFLREARAAAGLSHPSIVQIYDILEREEGDCIVMELVEGETLSGLLRRGPLPLAQTLALGREIAEGLAEAHAKGIVHRDLKTANVMVTPAGHAKILDFGLAKRLWRGDAEVSVSVAGEVLGTCHAMSPEQAQGSAIDHRSDLFSFGTLLYEAATGRRPFHGASPLETLSRVFSHRQAPAREVNPGLPQALSELIDRLLEKDPDHRPQSAGEVADLLADLAGSGSGAAGTPAAGTPAAGTLAAGTPAVGTPAADQAPTLELPGIGRSAALDRPPRPAARRAGAWVGAVLLLVLLALGWRFLRPQPAEPLYVAVPAPEITSAGPTAAETPDLRLVASGVRVALVRGLVGLEGIFPVSTDQVDAVAGTSVDVARAVAADEVVTARLDCAGLGCQVALSRVRGSDGSVLWIHDFGLAIDDLRLLTNSVAENLRTGYPGRDLRGDVPDLEVRSGDYEEYLRLRSDFQLRRGAAPLDQLLERLAAIRNSSPRFPEACILEAQIARYKFAASRDPEDLDRAFAAVAEARRLTPEDPQPLFNLFMLNLAGKRLDQAEEVLNELARLRPGEATVLAKRALLEDERGNTQQALALMRTAASRRPSWNNLYNLALVEYRHGEVAAARGHLQESLERSPGDFRSRSFLAQLELLGGSAAAVGLYEELAAGSSDSRMLNNLGMAYLLMQRYAEAASCFRRALELEPGAWETTLSLGQAELLLGREAEAKALYRRVLSLLDQDAAASDHYALAVRAEALARLGQLRQAATATQEALRLAPDHPFVAYQAALVYALIGDRISALVSTEKALSLGLGRRWFSLPWFDSLRSDADFRALWQAAEDPASKRRQQAGEGSPTG